MLCLIFWHSCINIKEIICRDIQQAVISCALCRALGNTSMPTISMMIYRLDVCFEHYPDFLKNPNIRQRVVELLQKAKDYIVKLEGEFAYD